MNDLKSKTIVVTGVTSGIGLATVMGLVKQGAYVIGIGRSKFRCEKACEKIYKEYPDARFTYLIADMSSLKEICELAEKIKEKVKENKGYLDTLINNAGTFASWYVSTPEGYELQWTVNHLAPFLLTNKLLPLLEAAPSGRIISVSSGSHYGAKIYWDDVLLHKHYNCLKAYKQSKLANVLFTQELNKRLGDKANVRAYAVDPGLVNTDIGLKSTTGLAYWIWKKRRTHGVSPEEGAKTSIYLASEPILKNKECIYWKQCRPKAPNKYIYRKDFSEKLWQLSERMCCIKA